MCTSRVLVCVRVCVVCVSVCVHVFFNCGRVRARKEQIFILRHIPFSFNLFRFHDPQRILIVTGLAILCIRAVAVSCYLV